MLNTNLKTELLYLNFTPHTTGNPLYSEHKYMRNNTKNALLKMGSHGMKVNPFPIILLHLKNINFLHLHLDAVLILIVHGNL